MQRVHAYAIAGLAAALSAAAPLAVRAADAPAASPSPSPTPPPLPDELEGVGIEEKSGEQTPLDLRFTDSAGKPVVLEQYFGGDRPVILNLGYYGCPMLCGLILNGMLDSLKDIDMLPGEDFEIITVSIDPAESTSLARLKKQNYLKAYGKPAAARGWHFLTGDERNIRALADAVGFKYKWIERRKEFSHSAALIVLTPEGKISRYLYGVQFPRKTLRLSLVEASEGKIGSTFDRITLYCFHYDPAEGTYTLAAHNVMRLGAVTTVLALGSVLGVAFLRERRQRRRSDYEDDPAPRP